MLPPSRSNNTLFIGLMSGTSLDGVDSVLTSFPANYSSGPIQTLGSAYLAFPAALRMELMALQALAPNEIHREALAANELARHYATCVEKLLAQADIARDKIRAIGVHGQTIRHRPELGYTRQINNPALLAELSNIDVIADFRSRDIAAGGQGAPLVPAFHQAVFAQAGESRVVANIGGMSNISILASSVAGSADSHDSHIRGFDTGPGNVLMDAWVSLQRGQAYDDNGTWAASGSVIPALLESLREDPFFALPPPKSTGRDLFHPAWLAAKLSAFAQASPADVQASLADFTATTLADAIVTYAATAKFVYACGGGAYNAHLLQRLRTALGMRHSSATVATTEVLGIAPNQVEALAFAWLGHRFIARQSGNLPAVTGAQGFRILGALYPA